ncbi:MAG: hypothetical protein HUN04_11180 [Desulfobacter sp.]|nr:MAG: hypothetical protein HUN04_11180 [Desulfobacter sp.]
MFLKKLKWGRYLLTAGLCILVAGAGMLGAAKLAASRQAPPHTPQVPKQLSVSAVPVETVSVRLRASGYGQAAVVNVLEISPRVSGNIIEKNPALEEGGMVEKGALLFRIDETDYAISLEKARAEVKLDRAAIGQYRISLERDRDRLAAVQKNTLLAKAEYERLKTLLEQDRVGTRSNVEAAEQSYNSLLDTEKSLKKTIALYPLQITEAENNLAKSRADLKTAELNLARCTVRAPFSGRIQVEAVEAGAYMAAGAAALTLADDRVLEIQVPLGDRDAFDILGLGNGGSLSAGAKEVGCRVESVTGTVTASAAAEIHRVVRYDASSRTVYLAVRVTAGAGGGDIPLTEGMFCKVMFKGRRVDHTVKIPITALNGDNTVYIARAMKLKTLKVSRVTADDTHAWVTGAFDPGDYLITSALANPIENTLLSIAVSGAGDKMAMVSGGKN